MRKGKGTIRRGAALVAVALGMLAISGSGASAQGAKLPDILNGQADSQALDLRIDLPPVAELVAALQEAGLGDVVVDLGDTLGDLGKVSIRQKISLNQAQVLRSVEPGMADLASGWAAVGQGDLLDRAVETDCRGGGCGDNHASAATRVDLPMNMGYLILNGAESATTSLVDTRNNAKLAEVMVDLRSLLNGELAVVGDALATLTTTVNESVLPVVNPALDQIEASVREVLPDNIEQKIVDRIISDFGHIKPIPDMRTVELLSLSILGADANIFPQVRGGVEGLLASSSSKIAGVNILGDWASIGAVDLLTEAYANGVAGGAVAKANASIVNADLGGALGIDITSAAVADLTNPDYLADAILGSEVAEQLKPALAELAAATKLVAQIAGIEVELFGTTERAAKNGMSAMAAAGTMKLTVSPRIPKAEALANIPEGGLVPQLSDDDFVSTGLSVSLTLPQSTASVALGQVAGGITPPPPTTGVATTLLGGLMLIGGAVTIRRFALSR